MFSNLLAVVIAVAVIVLVFKFLKGCVKGIITVAVLAVLVMWLVSNGVLSALF